MILNHSKEAYCQLSRGYEIEVPYFDDGNGNFLLDMDSILKFAEYAKSFSDFEENWIPVDVVLMPNTHLCCGNSMKMDTRYTTVITLYCEIDIKTVRSYHGKCSKWGKTYYNSSVADLKDHSRKFNEDRDFLVFSSDVGFSKKFLHNVDMQISIGVVSFEACAEIYNNTFDVQNKSLYPDCLEAGWFVHKNFTVRHFIFIMSQ